MRYCAHCILPETQETIKGLRKNNIVELALRFWSDLADPIEQNHRNS